MARTNNLTNFLTDVATAIKTKTGDSTAIPASQFDTKIAGITTGYLTTDEYTKANDDLDDILYQSTTGLPDTYQQVEYLESSGSQYLDLLRVPNNTDIIEEKFQSKNITSETISWYGSMPR